MSRVLTLSQPSTFRRITNRTASRNFKVGPVSLNFLTIIIISLLALFYLIQSQQAAAKNYTIKELQDTKAGIVSENEQLQLQASQLNSIENIESTAKSLQMVPSSELNYIDLKNLTRK